jgi:hypothetical protein
MRPRAGRRPLKKAGDALGTRKGPIYADHRRPQAIDETTIDAGFIEATTYRSPSPTIAQDFRQTTENRSVGGSIPPLGTIKINNLANIFQLG